METGPDGSALWELHRGSLSVSCPLLAVGDSAPAPSEPCAGNETAAIN